MRGYSYEELPETAYYDSYKSDSSLVVASTQGMPQDLRPALLLVKHAFAVQRAWDKLKTLVCPTLDEKQSSVEEMNIKLSGLTTLAGVKSSYRKQATLVVLYDRWDGNTEGIRSDMAVMATHYDVHSTKVSFHRFISYDQILASEWLICAYEPISTKEAQIARLFRYLAVHLSRREENLFACLASRPKTWLLTAKDKSYLLEYTRYGQIPTATPIIRTELP